jgi:hypothetical protein
MSRYRKVEVKMWGDAKFRELSAQKPSGQSLWIYLLTGPLTSDLPGILVTGKKALISELGWSSNDFESAWEEIERLEMALADWDAKLIYLPNALKHNPPANPNIIKRWKNTWDVLPECPLSQLAHKNFQSYFRYMGANFLAAFVGTSDGEDGKKAKRSPPPLFIKSVDPSAGGPLAYDTDLLGPSVITNRPEGVQSNVKDSGLECEDLPIDLPTVDKPTASEPASANLEPFDLLPPAVDPIVLHLRLKGGGMMPVTESMVKDYENTFPAVDVRQKLMELRLWLNNHPARCSIDTRGTLRRIAAWLGKAQEQSADFPPVSMTASGTVGDAMVSPAFQEFWDLYPELRRTNQADAYAVWKTMQPSPDSDDAVRSEIMAGLLQWTRSREWTKDGGQYVPNPARWLRESRWSGAPVNRHFALDDPNRWSGSENMIGMKLGDVLKKNKAGVKEG